MKVTAKERENYTKPVKINITKKQLEMDDPYVISLKTENKKLQNNTGQVRAPEVKNTVHK